MDEEIDIIYLKTQGERFGQLNTHLYTHTSHGWKPNAFPLNLWFDNGKELSILFLFVFVF